MQILGQNSNINCVTGQRNGMKMSPVQTLMYQHIPLSPAQQTQQSCGSIDGQTDINSSRVRFYNKTEIFVEKQKILFIIITFFQLNIGNSQLNNINSLGSYRNQQSNRPSPQSSPGLTIQVSINILCTF